MATIVEVVTAAAGTEPLPGPDIVKFAQVMIVAFGNCMSTLRFPMNAVVFGCVEMKRSM